jgi:hypothetical protein
MVIHGTNVNLTPPAVPPGAGTPGLPPRECEIGRRECVFLLNPMLCFGGTRSGQQPSDAFWYSVLPIEARASVSVE